MAVAAYATLLSLSHVLDNLQHPVRQRQLYVDTEQIQSLQEKVQFSLSFLEVYSPRRSEEIRDMGRLMADAAQEAEEVVDRHVVDQLRNRSQEESYQEWADVQNEQPMVSVTVGLPEVIHSGGKKSTMVGFDEHLVHVMDEITSGGSNLQILPIVGMGGIGSQRPYLMGFLNEEKGWNLFFQKTFAQEGCPYTELEETGKNIAKSCNGLPLAIVVVGGLLGKSNMTREY
ncbi:UNVERIFIED_CONTAM: putative disease resistance RPP13-like protein 3 [Sesamum latifolium]|uniref:Disease resistance RPP13-like protein 3 n=1 Tax=Sesamum latifolium TaxID=2727402 RepID=A0AAW2UJC1_9LAMI